MSKTHWFPFDAISRTDYVMQVQRTKMHLVDSSTSIAGSEEEDEVGFYLERRPNRPLPYQNNWHNSITFELTMDRRDYFRKVYGVLDLLSDVGGLFGAISPICGILLVAFNFWSSYQFLMDDLFVESS